MEEALNNKILAATKSILAVKKDQFWIHCTKDIILKNKMDAIEKQAEGQRGKKKNTFPWERNTTKRHPSSIEWWYNAGLCYDWLQDNLGCPKDQRGRACYQMLGKPRSLTPNTIFKFIDTHGDPRKHKEYVAWRSTENIEGS